MPVQVWEVVRAPPELGSGILSSKMMGPKGARLGGLRSAVAEKVTAEARVLLLVMSPVTSISS